MDKRNSERWKVRDKNGKVIMHRTPLKILFNPILRRLGLVIVSHFEGDQFVKYELCYFDKRAYIAIPQRRIWSFYE